MIILHKIMQHNNVKISIYHSTCRDEWYEEKIVDFHELSERAGKELQKCGNPPYDPSVYLNKEAWKLPEKNLLLSS